MHLAPDHCRRTARYGCGCKHCVAWRAALEAFHQAKDSPQGQLDLDERAVVQSVTPS